MSKNPQLVGLGSVDIRPTAGIDPGGHRLDHTKAKDKLPANLQLDLAVHVQPQAGQSDIKAQVGVDFEERLTDAHVELAVGGVGTAGVEQDPFPIIDHVIAGDGNIFGLFDPRIQRFVKQIKGGSTSLVAPRIRPKFQSNAVPQTNDASAIQVNLPGAAVPCSRGGSNGLPVAGIIRPINTELPVQAGLLHTHGVRSTGQAFLLGGRHIEELGKFAVEADRV